ncbi:MAG: hypothetical protein WC523_03830 [Patescibacteria group bacterium]
MSKATQMKYISDAANKHNKDISELYDYLQCEAEKGKYFTYITFDNGAAYDSTIFKDLVKEGFVVEPGEYDYSHNSVQYKISW